jgi:hypothetical protein
MVLPDPDDPIKAAHRVDFYRGCGILQNIVFRIVPNHFVVSWPENAIVPEISSRWRICLVVHHFDEITGEQQLDIGAVQNINSTAKVSEKRWSDDILLV